MRSIPIILIAAALVVAFLALILVPSRVNLAALAALLISIALLLRVLL
ncbi:MAG TPA: hypothetical protein VF507_07335 [Pyrinomonadaceae bacterium]|jgi:hypothetical protein